MKKSRWTGIPASQRSPLKNHRGTESPTALSSLCFFAVFLFFSSAPAAHVGLTHRLFLPPLVCLPQAPAVQWSWPRCYKLVSGRAKTTWWLFCWVKRPLKKEKKKKKSESWVSGWRRRRRRRRAVITPTRCDTAIRPQLKCNFVSGAAVAAARPSAQLRHSCLIRQDCRRGVEAADYSRQPTLGAVSTTPLWVFNRKFKKHPNYHHSFFFFL